jgi:hypothetical protein
MKSESDIRSEIEHINQVLCKADGSEWVDRIKPNHARIMKDNYERRRALRWVLAIED